ncbi:hypothetical protein K8R43_04110 [archaeon]|nr:hypothetical protein [archaeon]
MRASSAILFLILVSGAFAIEPVINKEDLTELGCTVEENYVMCPQVATVRNAQIQYTSDVECQTLLGEDQGCIGTAKIGEIKFKECQVYMPLLQGDVDYSGVQYNYNCIDKELPANTEVNIVTFQDLVTDCTLVEGDEYYEVKTCKTSGSRIIANISVSEEEGEKYVLVGNSFPDTGFHFELWQFAVLIVLAIALWVWYKNRK